MACTSAQAYLVTQSASSDFTDTKSKEEIANFYSGFLSAFGLAITPMKLLTCMAFGSEIVIAISLLYEAIKNALSNPSPEQMATDFIAMMYGAALTFIFVEIELSVCFGQENAEVDLGPLKRSIDALKNPARNVSAMTKNLMRYEDELRDDAFSSLFFYRTE